MASVIDDGGPAFPTAHESCFPHPGMSLRAWLTGKAMEALIGKAPLIDSEGWRGAAMTDLAIDEFRRGIAASARDYADAAIAALKQVPHDR